MMLVQRLVALARQLDAPDPDVLVLEKTWCRSVQRGRLAAKGRGTWASSILSIRRPDNNNGDRPPFKGLQGFSSTVTCDRRHCPAAWTCRPKAAADGPIPPRRRGRHGPGRRATNAIADAVAVGLEALADGFNELRTGFVSMRTAPDARSRPQAQLAMTIAPTRPISGSSRVQPHRAAQQRDDREHARERVGHHMQIGRAHVVIAGVCVVFVRRVTVAMVVPAVTQQPRARQVEGKTDRRNQRGCG